MRMREVADYYRSHTGNKVDCDIKIWASYCLLLEEMMYNREILDVQNV